ncbi:branched-chain amino acid ABC transporter permease [Bacillus dakarensis]|uniref:branched-chain amino acid ABC transporter permease n=1 Tax=Robertmurraya dakarensis TaxID=1926278 RepID=UPI000A0351AB|nr:branched-chain amino acid ABC transporter permease [Bacillus dakarensis]
MTKNLNAKKLSLIALCAIILLVIPILLGDYHVHVINQIGIFIILVTSLNLILGYTGQLSFAHIGLFAIGAYTSSILMMTYNVPFLLSLLLSMVASAFFGLLVGLIALRFTTHFFAIVTLAFGEIIRLIIYNMPDLTGGPNGIYNIPFPPNVFGLDFSQRSHFYYIILIGAVATVLFVKYMIGTRTGKAMIAVRENETFAQFIGINTWKVKMISFTLSAALAGFAGSIYAHYNSYISPYSFTMMESVTLLLMVIIGGVGTIFGPILGAAFLITLPELLRDVNEWRLVIFGALLVLTIMFMPKGLLGLFKSIQEKVKSSKKPVSNIDSGLGEEERKSVGS